MNFGLALVSAVLLAPYAGAADRSKTGGEAVTVALKEDRYRAANFVVG